MVLGGHTEDLRRWPGLLFDHTPAGRALMVATVVLVTPPKDKPCPSWTPGGGNRAPGATIPAVGPHPGGVRSAGCTGHGLGCA